jgi:hypothetical protein
MDIRSWLFRHGAHYLQELTLESLTNGSSLEEFKRASTEACGASLPLKFVVSMSHPTMVPAVPSFKMHLDEYTDVNLQA